MGRGRILGRPSGRPVSGGTPRRSAQDANGYVIDERACPQPGATPLRGLMHQPSPIPIDSAAASSVNSDKRNAYAVLALHKGATEDQIKQAYVELVKKYDPEKHTERFMVIEDAFRRLKDPQKRAREDILTFNRVPLELNYADAEKAEVEPEKLDNAVSMLKAKLAEQPAAAPQINPKLIQALYMRSFSCIRRKLIKEAASDLREILDLDPTQQRAKNNLLSLHCMQGYAYVNHKLFDEAIEEWEKAVRMNPDNHHVIHNLALALEFAERFDEATRMWQETLRRWKAIYDRNPEDEYLKTQIIEAHRHQSEIGKPPDNERPAPPPDQTGLAQRPAQAGAPQPQQPAPRPAAAPQQPTPAPAPQPAPPQRDELRDSIEILKLNPDDFEANMKVAHLLIEQKRWKESAAHLTELTKKFPRNIEVINMLGWTQINNQEVDFAFRTWARGLKLDPKSFQLRESIIKARMMLGRALREKSLFVNSLVHFKELARLIPDSDEVHFELGKTYQMKGDVRSAFLEYQQVLKLNPKHKDARQCISDLKLRR